MFHPVIFLLFVIASAALIYVCRKQLRNPGCHGFYRFFAFEGILLLALINLDPAGLDPLAPLSLFSAVLMLSSLGIVFVALRQLGKVGGKKHRGDTPENFAFENTEQLVTSGIYGYIRHPMYTSLLALNWGLYLQAPALATLAIPLLVSAMLYITARVEEKENQDFFGGQYRGYQRRSRMLIPFVF